MLPMDTNEHVVGAGWRKASRSVANGACVEAASSRATVQVRDSVDRSGVVVPFSTRTWELFIDRAKAGAFDIIR
jgi:hypothetical protein